jgi:hypothetical protein
MKPTVATLARELAELRAQLDAAGALAAIEHRLVHANQPLTPPPGARRRRHLWLVPS